MNNSIKNFKRAFFDLAFLTDILIVVLIVLFIRSFLFQPFQISWQSMYASYYDKEFMIVDIFSYLDVPYIKKWSFLRWDVVVFKPHTIWWKDFFIKRIIWLPEDTIKITDWKVYLKKSGDNNFVLLNEDDYLTDENNNHTIVNNWISEFVVPEWKYFLMWDNRNHSSDSRSCFFSSCSSSSRDNFIAKENIVGKVLLDLWYFNFRKFNFTHPELDIPTLPKFFSSSDSYIYK